MKTAKMIDVLSEVAAERGRQDAKWGDQNHNPVEWTAILGEEFGEASKEAVEYYFGHASGRDKALSRYRTELIQVAAVAVAMIECLDRNDWKETKNENR